MQIAMEVEATRELREQELPKEKIERSFIRCATAHSVRWQYPA